ncbi:MAG: TonB-dependent receptor [Polaribacter sp.]|nr:TonB-dependent receptor [Polaribacter sp.]
MKTKFNGILTLLLAFVVQISFAQEKTISGTVTDESGILPGVSILIKGTKVGTDTDFDGKYSIKTKVGDVLIYSYLGYTSAKRTVGASNTMNVTLVQGGEVLDEIIVTGVAGATNKNKLSISIDAVGNKLLREVPALNASTAIQGKVAGVTIVQPSGLPGSSASIRLRGATALTGSQSPLIILDGAFLSDANLSDFNAEDIDRIEILKGAAASSLFGSKAANGVIQIFSKRGKSDRTPTVTFRTEVGTTSAVRLPGIASKHAFQVNPDGSFLLDPTGGLIAEVDHIADNDFPKNFDHFDSAFKTALSQTQYLSVSGGSEKTNYLISLQNSEQESILNTVDQGYNRQNFRVNLDIDITDKLKLSTSNLLSKSSSTEPQLGVGGVFYNLALIPRHIDLFAENSEDGSMYDWNGAQEDPWPSQVTNPLYALNNIDYEEDRARVVSNMAFKYKATKWLDVNAEYSIDNQTYKYQTFVDRNFLDAEYNNTYINGYVQRYNYTERNQVFNAYTDTSNKFGELQVNTKLQFLNEKNTYLRNTITGTELGLNGVDDLDNILLGTQSVSSFESSTVSRSFAAILSLDYMDRYILDGLIRSDNVSLFGPNVRTQEFFRVSGAYRISKDLNIKNIDELKLRASYGTAGLLPPFGAWQDNFSLNNGIATANVVGNPNLGPYVTKEFETGIDFKLFNRRINGTFNYSKSKNEGQVIQVPLPALVNGGSQYQNAGTLETDSYEASLEFNIIKDKEDMSWTINSVFSKNRSTVTEFNRPDLQLGPNNAFLLTEGEEYGTFYGQRFITSLTQLPAGSSLGDYSINSRGFVVNANGTAQRLLDDAGNPVIDRIGNTTPDFNMSFNTLFSYKAFSFFALVDWSQGGDIYNASKQYQYRDFTSPDFDTSASQNLTTDFFASLYNVNDTSDAFVEDGTFVKLREVNLSYNLPSKHLKNTVFKAISFSLIGRNLLVITDYSGVDPEVADITAGGDLTSFRFDNFGFPATSTFSGSITLKF